MLKQKHHESLLKQLVGPRFNRETQVNNFSRFRFFFLLQNTQAIPLPISPQNGWARALYKPTFLVILWVWEMPLALTIL